MIQTQEQPPGGPENPTGQQVRVPTRERANEQQVRTVLAIVAQLNPYLLPPGSTHDQPGYTVEKNAERAASTTFTLAMNRLDEMLTNGDRWTATDGDSVVESIKATQTEIRKYYREQAATVADLRRPSRIFHPKFAKMGDIFSAFHASSDFPGGIIIGQGATPAEAMLDFDRAFNRIPVEQLKFNDDSLAKIYAAGIEIPPQVVEAEEQQPPRRKPRRKK